MNRTVKSITGHSRIDGVVPGIRGQRAFPNQELRTLDPFVMLDHIGPQAVAADYYVDGSNSAHPHRGFETITFMFEGGMNHKDSLGNRARLDSGSVQRMNAGKGIQHGGDFEGDKQRQTFHEVQLWVNLPAAQKMSEPDIHNTSAKEIPIIGNGDSKLRVIAGDNTVLLVIDWQQDLINVVQNIDQAVMMNNIQAMIKTANLFGTPVIETTIGVKMAGSSPTVESVKSLIGKDVVNIDRVSLNAWQNMALVEAVKKTGRKKILITGLWTSGCPTYTSLDALKDGYEVYILEEVMGDATNMAHNTAISRMVQAGAIPFTWEGAGAEMLRSYTHPKTMADDKIEGGFVGIMKEHFYPFAGKY